MPSAPSFRMFALSSVVGFATLLALAGCSSKEKNKVVNSGSDGITIQYDTRYPTMAGVDADEHCAKYGKLAVRVETIRANSLGSVTHPYAARGVFACERAK